MRLKDVFIVGGLPSITYVPRNERKLEDKLKRYLEYDNAFLSVTGQTKSGKTVLCKRIIGEENRTWLSGGEIYNIEAFWDQILHRLKLPVNRSHETFQEKGLDVNGKIESGGISSLVVRGSGQLSRNTNSGESSCEEFVSSKPFTAVEGLKRDNKVLIVDDFHYIPSETQKQIVLGLKSAVFDGMKVILVSVPHRGFDA